MALTDLDFLLKSAQNCKKCTFLDKLRAINQERNLKTRQMTSFLYLKIVKIHFHVVHILIYSSL